MNKPWYKRWQTYAIGFVALALLGAILPEPPAEKVAEPVVEESGKAVETVQTEATDKIEAESEETELTPLSKDEVLSMVTLDPDTKMYENGTFILKDNTLIKADMYFFNEGSGYVDGSAIFSDGKLARLKLTLEDDSGIAEAFEQFGIYDVENIERPIKMAFAYEYTFNEMFARNNIHRYPFELD